MLSLPIATGSGESDFVTDRSADAGCPAVTLALLWLLAVFGSNWSALVICAVLVFNPVVVTVAVIVKVAGLAGDIATPWQNSRSA